MLAAAASGEDFGAIAVDGSNVYWVEPTNPGAVFSVPIAGGARTTLATQQAQPNSIALANDSVYFTCFQFGILSVPLGGGVPVTVGRVLTPTSVAADSANVYFTSGDAVGAVPFDAGGVAHSLVQMPPDLANNIAIDSTSIYWTSGPGTVGGSLLKTALDGGPVTTLVSGACVPSYVTIHGSAAYYLACDKVLSVPLSGGTPTSLASTANASAQGIAADDTNVYWSEQPNGTGGQCAVIMKAPIGGGASTTLLVTQLYPNALATDGTNLYWSGPAGLVKLPLK